MAAGCSHPLGPHERRELLDSLDSQVRIRLFDPSVVSDAWLAGARRHINDSERFWARDRDLAYAINQCLRGLASHSDVHPPAPAGGIDEVQIPWVTTEEGVSVLRFVQSAGKDTIPPGDRVRGVENARAMRLSVEFRGRQSETLKIESPEGEVREIAWTWPAGRRSHTVASRVLPDGTLYVRIDSFTGFGPFDQGNFGEIRQQLRPATTAPGLILDLRGNPGGGRSAMDTATLFFHGRRVFAFFLSRQHAGRVEEQQLAAIRRLRPELSWLPWVSLARVLAYLEVMQGGQSFAIELCGDGQLAQVQPVVLIDEGTRSAAEMLAGFLQDQCGAKLVGRRSAGECAMPIRVPLPHGWHAHIAALRISTCKGKPIEGSGLMPDVSVVHRCADLALGRDADIEAALRLVAQRRSRSTASVVFRKP
jgi:C-terminal processing protease CtpA/Prc